jgi:hypothetical protein
MKGKIVVNKDSKLAYIPRNLIDEGYIGDVVTLANFNTVTLLRPGSTIDDQIESLELITQDLKMRKRAEEAEKVKILEPLEEQEE